MVISLHLVEEDLSIGASALGEEEFIDEIEDVIAVGVKLLLNLGLIVLDEGEVLRSILINIYIY